VIARRWRNRWEALKAGGDQMPPLAITVQLGEPIAPPPDLAI